MRPLNLTFVTGHAGTGKTTQLMELAGNLIPSLLTQPEFQSILAITLMHGARRRIDSALRKKYPSTPIRVTTIHSFALGVANRWRRALGLNVPIAANPECGGLFEQYGAIQASFGEILEMASNLVGNPTVGGLVAASYPLVIVDEFQDCDRAAISLIEKLAGVSQVILAADGFQDLTSSDDAPCEAINWLQGLAIRGAHHIDLSAPQRTQVNTILHTADCLRRNVRASSTTIEKFAAPAIPMLAWKIAQAFLSDELTGSCAVICLSADALLDKFLDSVNCQLANKNVTRGIRWTRIQNSDFEEKSLFEELGVSSGISTDQIWTKTDSDVLNFGSQASLVHEKVVRFAKLTGRKGVDLDLVRHFAQASLHAARSYTPLSGRFEVTTVHGAKNREFDNVFVFWGYRLPPPETRRKLLYNAVTRAKRRCILLVLQKDRSQLLLDPALRLLGEYPLPFGGRKQGTKAKAKKVRG